MTNWEVVAVAVSCLFGVSSGIHGQSPARGAQVIEVVANDYAFSPLPARIDSGPTLISFANHGKVRHEMSIGRLKAGATLDDIVRASKEGGRLRDLIDRSVGILVAGPGKSPDGRLMVDLIAGQTYLILCNLKDTPEARPHMLLGMYTSFRPQ
jgi:hypothetical protein